MGFFCWGLFNEKNYLLILALFLKKENILYVFHMMHIVSVYIYIYVHRYVFLYIYIYVCHMPPEARTVFQCPTFKVQRNVIPEKLGAGDIGASLWKRCKNMQKHSNPKNQEGFKQIIHTQKKNREKKTTTHIHTPKKNFSKVISTTPPLFFEKQKS